MLRIACCCAVVAASFVGASQAFGLEATKPETYRTSSTAKAKELVEAALQAGLNGDAATRAKLLAEAIAADPELELARWHSGQVKFNGIWRSPEQIGDYVSSHPKWETYRQLRQASGGSIADHVALAQWCMKNGLSVEERYHWTNVLLAAPDHKQARQRLSIREYRGGLFTEKQIAEHEARQKQAAENLKRYKPKFRELVRKARSHSRAQRTAALEQIRAITDLGAIPALQQAIGRTRRDSSDPLTRDVNLALVAALSRMREHDATLNLLNYALFSQSEEVRKQAALGLKSRPATDFVPLLMGALTAPIEVEFDVVAAPDGMVRMVQTLHQSGPEAGASHTQTTNFEVVGVADRDRTKVDPSAVLNNHLSRARAEAQQTQAQVDSFNQAAELRNARIEEVLNTATDMNAGTDPEQYWASWKSSNELYYDEEPVYDTYSEETYTYQYQQAPRYATFTPSSAPAPPPRSHSCFAPGTLVWTQAGPQPIEQIVVGDLVLAQHPTTGELAYRPVLQTTLGSPTPVLRISVQGETITATYGHRFWVSGSGWRMAKELKPAHLLHATDRELDVTTIAKGDDLACHNLVVDEFHTFFVGKSRMLVHDKSCPAPTLSDIPGHRGMPPQAESDVALAQVEK